MPCPWWEVPQLEADGYRISYRDWRKMRAWLRLHADVFEEVAGH